MDYDYLHDGHSAQDISGMDLPVNSDSPGGDGPNYMESVAQSRRSKTAHSRSHNPNKKVKDLLEAVTAML